MGQDRRHEPEPEIRDPPDERRNRELDHPRVGRLLGVVRVARGENEGLEHHGAHDPEAPLPEARAEERRAGDGDRAKRALLPERGEERGGHRQDPRLRGCEKVGLDDGFGRRPPSVEPRGAEVEEDDVAELERGKEVGACGPAERGSRRGHLGRPEPPLLQVVREGAPVERLGGQIDEGEQRGADHGGRGRDSQLPCQEGPDRDRGVVLHPAERERIGHPQAEEDRGERAPGERRPPDDPASFREKRGADAAADQEEEDDEDGLRAEGDRLVRRPHLGEALRERLGHVDEMGESGGPVAGDPDPQPEPAVRHLRVRALEDEGVVETPTRLRLPGGLEELEGAEVHAPLRRLGPSDRQRLAFGRVPAPGVVLPEPQIEPVRLARRREPDTALLDRPLGEAPDRPDVGVVDPLLGEPHEGIPSAGLELDVGLHLGVGLAECRGRPGTGRVPTVAEGEGLRFADRGLAVHHEIEGDDRKGSRKEPSGNENARRAE